MTPKASGLSLEGLGYLNYLRGVLTQPLGSWEGFYPAQSHSMNFALRYQLAFASYAVAAMAQHTPAYRTPYTQALHGAIEKMLDVATWGYWRAEDGPDIENGHLSTGHATALLSPHRRAPAGPPSDPIARDNLQYSGHLSVMLGLYEKVSGDRHYDEPFTLHNPSSDVEYVYTHSRVAARIHSQMLRNKFGGVCCEPGMAYVPCNNYALASNTLHDTLHGTRYISANAQWLRTVRDKMALRGPALRGVFGASYVKDLGLATPVAFNFTDAWGLAFLVPFDRPLTRKLYGRFKKKVSHAGSDGAYVDSSGFSEKLEISDVPINTGFGLILARALGDAKLADAFSRYASTAFDIGWRGGSYLLRNAPRTLHSTALYALAQAIEVGGADFAALFNNAPDLHNEEPRLDEISGPLDRVGISQAEYDAGERALRIIVRLVGDPSELGRFEPLDVALTLANIAVRPAIHVDGALLPEASYKRGPDGKLHFAVTLHDIEPVSCTVRW